MSENLKNTVLRFAIVFMVIALLFGVVFVRIIVLQTAQRGKWEGVVNREDNYKSIKAIRGSIYDCEGRLLASSVPQYRIFMDTRVEALHMDKGELFWDHVDSIAAGLSRIVGDQTQEEYRNRMVEAYRKGKIVRLTQERISYTQLKEIKQLPLVRRGLYKSGLYAEDLNLRVKPFSSLGSRAIGNIYAASGEAKSGLEMRFDSYLRGEDGMSVRQKIAGGWQNVPIREAVNGCDIYTTFDANLMDICETALRERLELRNAEWGCVVLMDVQTGEIKAMSNLDRAKDGSGYYEMANHAVVRMEPGSTFKTISLMAALDDGKVKMKDTIRVEKDGWWYHGAKHTDAHPSDTVYTIRQAMAVSSNIALAKIVTDGYNGSAKKFVKKLQNMGLCDSVDFTIPGANQALINVPKDTVTISKMAYGYSVELSPLQILMFYNGIANGGKMISPLFVSEIRENGKVIETFESSVVKSSMCDGSTLEGIRGCLHDVVWDNELGTASVNPWGTRKAQSDLVIIAGKTGTAQVLESGYHNTRHRMSFVGYFPEENPQYSCICVIHAPQWPYDSGLDCGGVVRQVAEKTMAYAGEYVYKKKEKILVVNK
ncbi:MAG: penicillin-binding protein 2 [Paludibacteraceae bacterium]|nr:penicillin-binding protein 2 [Paludibacteraceae bacterium]